MFNSSIRRFYIVLSMYEKDLAFKRKKTFNKIFNLMYV